MKLKFIAILFAAISVTTISIANTTTIELLGLQLQYPQTDNITLTFDDQAGATTVPYWLNGFVSGQATLGYTGTLSSATTAYTAPVFIAFTPADQFYIFQECTPSVKCYLALSTATNVVPTTVNPRAPGNLGSYLQENLANLVTFAGPSSGWNVSLNTPPSFPETFPRLQVVKPLNVQVSVIPEPSPELLFAVGLFSLLAIRADFTSKTGA